MAIQRGVDSQLFYTTVEMSSYLTDASLTLEGEVAETTTWGATGDARTFIRGLSGVSITMTGFSDESMGNVANILAADHADATGDVLTYTPAGDAIGNPAYGGVVLTTSTGQSGSLGGAIPFDKAFTFVNGGGGGHVLHNAASVTGTGATATVDCGASTANGGVALIHVTAASLTSATVKVQDSPDDAVWADLATFTAVTGTTSEAITVAAGTTVDRYLRFNCTALTGTSFTPVVSFIRYT